MDSVPAEIREFLRNHNLSNVWAIIQSAVTRNRVDVLEWLHERIPGGAAAEDCRTKNHYALRRAACDGHVAVLEWFHGHTPGGVAAEDCRSDNNNTLLLCAAYHGHVAVLEWLHQHIPGGITVEDCRTDNNAALRWAAGNGHVAVLEWLATKLTLAEFAQFGRENVWRQVWRKSVLALVVAGKRKKLRLPPELWELVEQWY